MTKGSCQSTTESKVHPWVKPAASARFIRSMSRRAGGSVCRTSPMSTGLLAVEVLAGGARLVAAVAGASEVVVPVDDDGAAGEHGADLAGDPPALVRRVVDVHVVGLGGDRLLRVRVVDHD